MSKTLFLLFITGLCFAAASVGAQQVYVTSLHRFTDIPDGRLPGSIVMGSGNAIYGVTWRGGDTNLIHDGGYNTKLDGGTIFKINTDGSGYTVLHTFSNSETHNSGPGKLVPGSENGISIAAGRDGMIYGTTEFGTNTFGMVFRCNSDGNDFTILHNFTSASDGQPLSLIQGRDGTLYGTTFTLIFALDPDGGNYRVLHAFAPGEGGGGALGRLLHANDGALYGTTLVDDVGGEAGSVFKVTTNGNYTLLHKFPGTNGDGFYPMAGLMQGNDGALYGTTYEGGTGVIAGGAGTVFKINTDGGGYQVLHNFYAGDSSSNDGGAPIGELVQGSDGALYGTTSTGFNNDQRGTIFRINPDGGGYNVLYNFPSQATTGTRPFAGLLAGPSSGNTVLMYGTASFSGTNNSGAVYSMLINPPSLTITPGTIQTPGGQTVIYWPAWAFNYTLQTTTNLASNNWVTVSNATPVSAVAVTNNAPAAYFRLIYQ